MIALLDYRAGNLTSVRKAFAAVGADVCTPTAAGELGGLQAIVVPGVGHFGATAVLDSTWRDAILAAVRAGTPLLGICLGLQWLFDGSDEAPDLPGLGLLRGRCTLLRPEEGSADGTSSRLKVPHVGWNALTPRRPSRMLDGVAPGAQAYFTHSYVAPIGDACVATTSHGAPFASVVEHDRIFGAQFHPEKSGDVGLRLLRNFLDVMRGTP